MTECSNETVKSTLISIIREQVFGKIELASALGLNLFMHNVKDANIELDAIRTISTADKSSSCAARLKATFQMYEHIAQERAKNGLPPLEGNTGFEIIREVQYQTSLTDDGQVYVTVNDM